MSVLHDCARAGCLVKPDGTAWAVPPKPTGECVWDNTANKLITRAAAKLVVVKEE